MSSSGAQPFGTTEYLAPPPLGGGQSDSANIQALVNRAHANGGGVVVLQSGSYRFATTVNRDTDTAIVGTGSNSTFIYNDMTNDAVIRVQSSSFDVNAQTARLEGFRIKPGNFNTGNGLHIGDCVGGAIIDVVIDPFTGPASAGILWENAVNWTERFTLIRVSINGCTINMRYIVTGTGTSSFGYTRMLDTRMNINANGVGIQLENNASLYNGFLEIMANVNGTGATLIKLIGTARIDHGYCDIHCEGGTTPTRFNLTATNYVATLGQIQWAGVTPTDTVAAGGILMLNDTGWRQVAVTGTGWTGNILFRRVGNIVYAVAGSIVGTSATVNQFINLPAGFSWDQFSTVIMGSDGSTNTAVNITLVGGGTPGLATTSRAGSIYFVTSWPTNDPWPTTLPGTLVTSPPQM